MLYERKKYRFEPIYLYISEHYAFRKLYTYNVVFVLHIVILSHVWLLEGHVLFSRLIRAKITVQLCMWVNICWCVCVWIKIQASSSPTGPGLCSSGCWLLSHYIFVFFLFNRTKNKNKIVQFTCLFRILKQKKCSVSG